MTRRGPTEPAEGQLVLDLEDEVQPEIEHARRVRTSIGLEPSLTSPEVLLRAIAALRSEGRPRGDSHRLPAA